MEAVGVIGLGLMGGAAGGRFRGRGCASSASISAPNATSRLSSIGGNRPPRWPKPFAWVWIVFSVCPAANRGRGDPGCRRIDWRRDHHRHHDRRPRRRRADRPETGGYGTAYVDATITGSSYEARAGRVIVTAGGCGGVPRERTGVPLVCPRWFHVGSWVVGA